MLDIAKISITLPVSRESDYCAQVGKTIKPKEAV